MKAIYHLPAKSLVRLSFPGVRFSENDRTTETEFEMYFDGLAVSGAETCEQGEEWLTEFQKHNDLVWIDIIDKSEGYSIEVSSSSIRRLV